MNVDFYITLKSYAGIFTKKNAYLQLVRPMNKSTGFLKERAEEVICMFRETGQLTNHIC